MWREILDPKRPSTLVISVNLRSPGLIRVYNVGTATKSFMLIVRTLVMRHTTDYQTLGYMGLYKMRPAKLLLFLVQIH